MQLDVYYIFVPTPALIQAAREAGQEWLLETNVWIDVEDDRTGRAHPRDQVEKAAWTVFLAKLANNGAETDAQRTFRHRCLALGHLGCWSLYLSKAGDRIADLVAEANEVAGLAELAARP